MKAGLDSYDVYFVEDSQTFEGLTKDQIRPAPPTKSGLGSLTRQDLVDQHAVWFFDGAPDLKPGLFKVRAIGKKSDTYECVRQSDGGEWTEFGETCEECEECEEFDIGYVMRTIRNEEQQNRER